METPPTNPSSNPDSLSKAPEGAIPPVTTNGDSKLFGVSMRAWIACMIVFFVLANWTMNSVFMSLGWTSANTDIPEPIYSVFIATTAYFFGQATAKK